MPDMTHEAIEELIQLGQAAGDPKIAPGGNIPYAIVPNGCSLKPLSELVFNEHSPNPARTKGTVTVLDPESFVEYFSLFRDSQSRVFAYEPEIKVVGVIDYPEAGGLSRWSQHRVLLSLRQSEEWKAWAGRNNKQMSQTELAEFLEQHSIDIVTPAPADMMEVARDLEATKDVEFGSGQKMENGQVRFQYTETVKATVKGGQLAVPERFTVSLPAFIGGTRVEMDALLRFRVKEGKLVIWHTLVRPEEVVRVAFTSARSTIAESLGVTIINGVPA